MQPGGNQNKNSTAVAPPRLAIQAAGRQRHGSGVLVPYLTQRTEPAFHAFIKNKNNTVPW